MPKKFDKWVSEIKKSVRKSHPKWSEKKVESVAYATARDMWKKKYGKDPLK